MLLIFFQNHYKLLLISIFQVKEKLLDTTYYDKIQMIIKNYDESIKINHNTNWPYIPDHPYRILIIAGSGSGKNNVLLNLIKHQRPDFDKKYLYVKDQFESKYKLLIDSREKIVMKNPKAFIYYSQKKLMMFMKIYKNVTRQRKE